MALEKIIRKEGREYLQLANPANGRKIFNPVTKIRGEPILINNEEEVRMTVAEARKAYEFWRKLDKKERGHYLKTLKHLIAKYADKIAGLINEENGKPMLECYEEPLASADMLKYYQSKGLATSREFRGTSPINKCKRIKTTEVPSLKGRQLGVSAAITPWNYPLMVHFNIAARSLYYGNTLIIKPSEQVPYSAEFVQYLADKAWEKAGLWKKSGALKEYEKSSPIKIVQGDGRVGKLLVDLLNEEKIDFLLFCGSSKVGRKIKQAANDKSKLELLLGGNDPFIILEDCDLDTTVDALIGACLYNGGQSCSSTERVYVAESIADAVIEKVLEKVEKIEVGYNPDNPYIDMGPLMNSSVYNTVMDHIQDAKAKSAKVLFGGKRKTGGIHNLGYYLDPTVLVNVDHSMRIMSEETFGPTIPIMTFETEEEAIELANDSEFGLTANIWTKDIKRAKKMAEKIEAGTIYINDWSWTASEPRVHWPGAKASGNFIDEEAPYADKVIAITKGNRLDKKSYFWFGKKSPGKLRFLKNMIKTYRVG